MLQGIKNRLLSVRNVVLVLIPVIFYLFYRYVGFDMEVAKMIKFVTALGLFLYFVLHISRLNCFERGSYGKYVSLFLLLSLVSVLNAFVYWGQSPVLTFRAGATVFMFVYYFVLKRFNVSVKYVEGLVFLFAAIYVVLWLYAVSQAPRVVFGNEDEVSAERGFYRIYQLPGIHAVAFAYFISLHRASSRGNGKKLLWIVLSVAGYVLVLLSMSRALFFSITVVTLYGFMRNRPFVFILMVVVLLFAGDRITSESVILRRHLRRTTKEMDDGKFGSRSSEYNFFIEAYPSHVGTVLCGNGKPHVQSKYGRYEEKLKRKGFHRSDVGWIELFVTYGVLSVALFVCLLLKIFRQRRQRETTPCASLIYYICIAAVSGTSLVSSAFPITMALYILEQYRIKEYEENSDVSVWRYHD